MNMEPEQINVTLRDHQRNTPSWDFSKVVAELHCWAERMILEFKLQIPFPCILIERLRLRYGHFRPCRNGFGLKDEIGLDEAHVRNSPFWRVCGTLLHELLHVEQKYHGRPGRRNYHNKQFRQTAAALGLVIDQRGYTQFMPGATSFFSLLKKYGVDFPAIPEVQQPNIKKVGSKLKLYECRCGVKVRVGRSCFHAQCLDCGGAFVFQENSLGPAEPRRQKLLAGR